MRVSLMLFLMFVIAGTSCTEKDPVAIAATEFQNLFLGMAGTLLPANEEAKPNVRNAFNELELLGHHTPLTNGSGIHLDNNDTLVFLGDSITRQCLYTQYVENYYYTRFPKTRVRFRNAGVGGDRAADVLLRFDDDVAPHKPKYVAVLLGMNDGSYKQYSPALFHTYEEDMTSLLRKITDLGARPILITPTMFDVSAHQRSIAGGSPDVRERSPYYNGVLAAYGSWLREQSFNRGWDFVDMHGPFNRLTVQQRRSNPDFTLTNEGIHPNPVGHLVMAHTFLRDMAASDTVSAIHVLQEEGTWQVKTTQGIATDLQGVDNISLTFLADSLPWVVPDEALPGYQLVNAGSTLSRETLRISGLKPARYQLLIDEEKIGIFSHSELACGIDLQENVNTPQYKQARDVAQLNKERNEKGVYVLRDLWTELKDRRQEGQFESQPIEQWFPSFPAKVKELLELMEGYEQRIYRINQPVPRRYKIMRAVESK